MSGTAGGSTARPAVRAGILVTGTEVLSGIISDRNGPWLSEQLRELGVDAALIAVVGDRPDDLLAALRQMDSMRLSLIITSGGLGPTADDLTTEVVGRFCEREMVLDERLERLIAEILAPMMKRWPGIDPEAIRTSNRKQAVIPAGATVIDPVGTAPGLVVPFGREREPPGPTVVVLPGPPRELQPMWRTATQTDGVHTRDHRGDRLPAGDRAPVRAPRVGDRRHAARRRGGRPVTRGARDHDLPASRRDRGRQRATSRPHRPPTTR